jgi:hypothetical protein
MRIEDFANGDFRELSAEEAWDTIEDCAQYYYRIDNPTNVSTSQLNINFQDHETSLFGDEYISVEIPNWLSCNAIVQAEHIGDLDVMEDLAEHDHIHKKDLGPMIDDDESQETYDESLGQFVYSSQNIEDDPYDSDIEVEMPKEVREILGKMLGLDNNETHVEDIGLNTYNDNLILSYREVPSFDEPEPQPKPLPNLLSLDENLGIEIGSDPPIKPYSPGSLRIKVVDFKPCREEANIGVEHNLTCLHHPFMIDHKKHYGFKPGLLGQDGSPTRSLLKLIENDPFLEKNLNPPINPIELGKVMMIGAHPFEHIIHPPLFTHVAYFHPKGVYRYFHPHLILSVGKTSPISIK